MDRQTHENSIIEYMLTLLHIADDAPLNTVKKSDAEPTGAELLYLETARQIKAFIDEIPGGFLIYNADGAEEIVYANKALISIFKCKNLAEFKTLTGNSFVGMVHPDDIDAVQKSIKSQISNSPDNLDYVEYRIMRKDGIVRWVEDYGHFIHSETAGNFYYVFISDATEKVTRRMAETATIINEGKLKEQKLQSLIEEYDKERKLIRQEHLQRLEVIEGLSVNYDSILYADLDGNKVLPYRLSSRLERQFEQRLQVRELQWFLTDYVKVWVHPDDRERVRQKTSVAYIKKALENNQTYYLNYRCIQNGETQYIQLRIVNVGNRERVSQIVMGYRNIDEEVLQQMKQKQLLEVALNNAKIAEVAKNTFLSNMSHDMRTPLNAIFGYVALAKKNADKGKSTRAYLDKIETASNQILELIDKVLEISYMETQDYAVKEGPCNILDFMRDIHAASINAAAQKNISLTLHADSVKHANVFADSHKLAQVLNHIVGNAIKYTKADGNVVISLSEKTNDKSGEFVTFYFTVEDNGIGISKHTLERIFEPFEREHNTTLSGVYGLGLGLTIAKHLMETMGGDITVESELGKGSKFTAILSLRADSEADEQQTEADAELTSCAHGKKILIVEDNEINLEIETEILQDLGYETDFAPNGKIAVEKVQSSANDEYALVLMDIQMPVMDGRTAAKEIRKLSNAAHANIPIIALSANAFESDKRESIEAGMNAHLTKPIDVPVLSEAIKSAICEH